uniref:protein-L-isoaspartate(D-aspartate) O-methyltransferase n=1 Tax=uncultured Poseidoniia archaeon TaxID=1697135 RepID=A0A1B1TB86_9ARCH|nr:protein-L-isoaspartate O-methyltransferase [uncultured Candidatus Thalassoarchaea sp.]
MTRISDLLKRLEQSDIEVPRKIRDTMENTDVEMFSDFDTEPFYSDRPIQFMETIDGKIKTISAPHMIVTLLHHLELNSGQEVILIGSKGGYLAALIAQIIGEKGNVRVLDQCDESILHAKERLTHWPTIEMRTLESIDVSPVAFPGEFNRVLITGHIENLPEWISARISEGGFVIAPLGPDSHQQLVKMEKQDNELLPTDLGPVCFGPLDDRKEQNQMISPIELADLLQLVIETCQDLDIIEQQELNCLQDIIAELHFLPDDLPPLGEGELTPSEHPMFKSLIENADSFVRFWPILQVILHPVLSEIGFENWIFDDFEGLE